MSIVQNPIILDSTGNRIAQAIEALAAGSGSSASGGSGIGGISGGSSVYYAPDYNIKPENADNTYALQSLIDNVWQAGGGIILLSNGTYKVNCLNMRSKVSLYGVGSGSTKIKRIPNSALNAKGSIKSVFDDAGVFILFPAYSCNCVIQDITFDGDRDSDGKHSVGIGFSALPATGTVNILTSSNTDYIPTESDIITYKNITLRRIKVVHFTDIGISLMQMNFLISFENIYSGYNYWGMDLRSNDSYFCNMVVEHNRGVGVYSCSGNSKFYGIKSIWNGADSEIGNWKIGHSSYAWVEEGSNNTYYGVETQDNMCNGFAAGGGGNQFFGLVLDTGGYLFNGESDRLAFYTSNMPDSAKVCTNLEIRPMPDGGTVGNRIIASLLNYAYNSYGITFKKAVDNKSSGEHKIDVMIATTAAVDIVY